jgi:hypothetical protein
MDTTKLTESVFGLIDHVGESLKHVEDTSIGTVAIVVEVNGMVPDSDHGEGGSATWVLYRCTDDRRWVQAGLFDAAKRATLLG